MKSENFFVYILFSESFQRYYVGMTSKLPEERLRKHLSNHKGFTAKAKDWDIVYQIKFESKQEALELEKRIKNRGINRWIQENN